MGNLQQVLQDESAQTFPRGGAGSGGQRSPHASQDAPRAAAVDADVDTFQREPARVQVPLAGITSGSWMIAEVSGFGFSVSGLGLRV